jgi:sulfatase maturation enzyme AslB (radical SAM superfamily)
MNELFIKVHDRLPLFRIDDGDFMILYTPGNIVKLKKIEINRLLTFIKKPETIADRETRNIINNLLVKGGEAVSRWEQQRLVSFNPECLTIHAGSDCNLNCSYCYGRKDRAGIKTITGLPDLQIIKAAARYVAEKIKETGGRLTVVYHGSGEPTVHWTKLVESFNVISSISRYYNIPLFTYIATNSCLTAGQTDWLARNMNLICISFDGPASTRQHQREAYDGQYLPTEKVCDRIIRNGGLHEIRVTITSETIREQEDIARHIVEKMKPGSIRVEPVYLAGENGFGEEDADTFFSHFKLARDFSGKHGVVMSYAGVRINELHGTYCDVLRNNLRLIPGNKTVNCFCNMMDKPFNNTGVFNGNTPGSYLSPLADEIKIKASRVPDECTSCINVFHCSRGCPDFCILDNDITATRQLNPFRCRLNQLIAVEKIRESATARESLFTGANPDTSSMIAGRRSAPVQGE